MLTYSRYKGRPSEAGKRVDAIGYFELVFFKAENSDTARPGARLDANIKLQSPVWARDMNHGRVFYSILDCRLALTNDWCQITMDDLGQSWEELLHSLESSRPRMLLRKLVDHYCGVYLIRVLEGFIHNLNNPLQILWVRSEQLVHNIEKLREALETEAVAEAKELIGGMELKIDSFVKGLEGLYSNLGFLTRGALFKERSEIGQVKIKEVIEDTLFLLNANMFFKHSVQKTLKLDDTVPELRGRHTDLCIIMLNLIQNALESMADAEEKHLTIETSSQGANVIIKVGDTGCGIREENRQDIYKPFFTTKRGTQYEGKLDEHLGIGLSLVSFLLEDYHGHVSFESIPGNTTFTLELET